MSSFRQRLFRPYRWRLWVQFIVLGAFVVIVPIVFTSQRLLDSGREVLIAHEIIDLSDESNLRINEFREDLAYLAVDVKKKITEEYNAANLKPDLDRISKTIGLPDKQNWQPPTTVNEARRRYLHGTNAGVFRFEYDQGEVRKIASRDPLTTDPRCLNALKSCFADAAERLAKSPLINRSGFHYIPGEDGQPGRTVLAFTENKGVEYFTLLLDFSRYVWNRQQVSPRHYYLVIEPDGRVLIRPDTSAAGERPRIEDLVGWEYPKFAESSWFDGKLVDAARKQRLAFAVRDGGARLKAVEVTTLRYSYQKGSFSIEADLSTMLGRKGQRKQQRY